MKAKLTAAKPPRQPPSPPVRFCPRCKEALVPVELGGRRLFCLVCDPWQTEPLGEEHADE